MAFVEEKLRGAGIKEKLIPADQVLLQAYKRGTSSSRSMPTSAKSRTKRKMIRTSPKLSVSKSRNA